MQINTGRLAKLIFFNEATQEEITADIAENASTIVGRDGSCSIVLEDQKVSGRHCMFRLADGVLYVSDWHSEHGTMVNDQPIKQETSLQAGDQISIGSFDVRWSVDGSAPTGGSISVPPTASSENGLESSTSSGAEWVADEPAEFVSDVSESDFGTEPDPDSSDNMSFGAGATDSQVAKLQRENDELRRELEQMLASEFSANASLHAPMDLEQQEVQLLRDEVSQLQSELAEREQQLAELVDAELADPSQQDDVSPSETAQLVSRLEDLLDELHASDRRVSSMEELLLASDEARQAEEEERQQIEIWLSEIESRIGRREEEWKSQNEQLVQRLDYLDREREQNQMQLSQALKASGNQIARQAEEKLAQTQKELDEISRAHETLKSEFQTNQSRLAEFEEAQEDGETSVELKNRLRAQELEMVQERAAMSRQKAELAKMRDELERTTVSSDRDPENSDLRVKALRDHLREIHDQEEEQKNTQSGGLAARLSRLWNRLDSR